MEARHNNVLIGWKSIESFMRLSRMTLIRKNYPVKKEKQGSIWAIPDEMIEHRITISSCPFIK